MSIAIPSTAHNAPAVQTVLKPKPAAATPSPAPAPKASSPAATVNISSAATAIQESLETSAQTAKEAGHGDQQAVRLLAREAAAKKA